MARGGLYSSNNINLQYLSGRNSKCLKSEKRSFLTHLKGKKMPCPTQRKQRSQSKNLPTENLTLAELLCPKFNTCAAPICPLDPLWEQRVWVKDERVCHYMRNPVRGSVRGAYTPLKGSLVPEAILDKYPRMRHRIS